MVTPPGPESLPSGLRLHVGLCYGVHTVLPPLTPSGVDSGGRVGDEDLLTAEGVVVASWGDPPGGVDVVGKPYSTPGSPTSSGTIGQSLYSFMFLVDLRLGWRRK